MAQNLIAKQTDTALEKQRGTESLEIAPSDIPRLRDLAKELAELAAQPSQQEKRRRWRENNDLVLGKPMILCDPENGWQEILSEKDLRCQGELARSWELSLLKTLYWGKEMGDDRVVEAVFTYSTVSTETDYGMVEKRIRHDDRGSFTWEPPLKSYDDLPLLKFPKITVDQAATQRKKNLAEEIFGDILRVYRKNYWWWSLGMTYQFVLLRGLENLMYDMYDYPEGVHGLMKFLMDSTLDKLDFLEREGLLSQNSDIDFIGSHSHGFTNDLPKPDGVVTPMNMWGFCESQETVSVSPDMFREFVFPYQLTIAKRFGLNYYGCCEPLDQRFSIIQEIPRLRKISASPWANLDKMREFLGKNYVMSIKPNPAYVALENPDWAIVRSELKRIFRSTRGCVREVIMKDLNTIGKNPEHVKTWCRIAQEEAELA